MTTLRIVNDWNENGGEWFCEPGNKERIEYVKRELKIMQGLEPHRNWKLQCRGTQAGWHDWQD